MPEPEVPLDLGGGHDVRPVTGHPAVAPFPGDQAEQLAEAQRDLIGGDGELGGPDGGSQQPQQQR